MIRAETIAMNGIGIGTAVGLGAMIGLGLVSGGASLIEFVTTGAFYGLLSGFVYHFYEIALTDWKPKFPRFPGRS